MLRLLGHREAGLSAVRCSAVGIALACALLVTSLAACSARPPASTPPPPSAFVARAGTQLVLGGQPFRFEGLNIYMAASHGTCGGTVRLNSVLRQIGKGQNVFRIWLFQPFVVRDGKLDWSYFDDVLAAAARDHERVIVTLANEWAYCDGPLKTLGWWQTGYRTAVGPGDLTTYRRWVETVVSRYRDNPTIAMWQLVNEGTAGPPPTACHEQVALQAMISFAQVMGALVKAIDHRHLLSLGDIPGSCGDTGPDYQTLNALAAMDVCDYHDYGAPTQPMGVGGINGLQAAIDQCHADGKPIMVAETGILVTSPQELPTRAAEFRAKFAAQLQADVVGELMWSWVNASTYVIPPTAEDYGIGPGDPSLRVLGTY